MYLISKDLIKLDSVYNILFRDISTLKRGTIGVDLVIKSINSAKEYIEWIKSRYDKLLNMVPSWKDEIARLLEVFNDSQYAYTSPAVMKIYLERYSNIISSIMNFKDGVDEERRNIQSSRLVMVEDALSSVLDELKCAIKKKDHIAEKELVSIAYSLVSSSDIVKIGRFLSDDIEFVYVNFITAASLVESEGSEYNYSLAYSTLGLLISKIQGLHEII